MKKRNLIIILVLLFIVLGGILLFVFNNKMSDAERFSEEYTEVGEDNVFVYRTSDEVIKLLKHGTGVLYLGFYWGFIW